MAKAALALDIPIEDPEDTGGGLLGPGFQDPNVRAWAEGRESSYLADVEEGRSAFLLWRPGQGSPAVRPSQVMAAAGAPRL